MATDILAVMADVRVIVAEMDEIKVSAIEPHTIHAPHKITQALYRLEKGGELSVVRAATHCTSKVYAKTLQFGLVGTESKGRVVKFKDGWKPEPAQTYPVGLGSSPINDFC